MYLSDGQLLRLSDEGLEAAYGWARFKQKRAYRAREFGLARNWEAIAGQCTRELVRRQTRHLSVVPSDDHLF